MWCYCFTIEEIEQKIERTFLLMFAHWEFSISVNCNTKAMNIETDPAANAEVNLEKEKTSEKKWDLKKNTVWFFKAKPQWFGIVLTKQNW